MATTLTNFTIVKGTTVWYYVTWLDQNGARLDMTQAGRSGAIRLRTQGSTGAVTYSKSTSVGAEWAWVDQAQGTGYFIWDNSDTPALTSGVYDVEIYFTGGSDVHLVGTGVITIAAPATGTL